MKSPKRRKRPAGQKQYYRRKKVCKFCVERIDSINYKDVKLLSQFVPERAKIMPRRISGVCSPHQRRLNDAIKKARNIALLPFATSNREGDHGSHSSRDHRYSLAAPARSSRSPTATPAIICCPENSRISRRRAI